MCNDLKHTNKWFFHILEGVTANVFHFYLINNYQNCPSLTNWPTFTEAYYRRLTQTVCSPLAFYLCKSLAIRRHWNLFQCFVKIASKQPVTRSDQWRTGADPNNRSWKFPLFLPGSLWVCSYTLPKTWACDLRGRCAFKGKVTHEVFAELCQKQL